jgi:ZIP family zinc transporter
MNVTQNAGMALMLSLLAGLSTGIGSAIAYFIKRPKLTYLSFLLGLSAGVMIYISFMELLPKALNAVGQIRGLAAFFAGIGFIGLIDMLVPKAENPHHYQVLDSDVAVGIDASLMRTGLMVALAIGLHNIPEGLTVFFSTIADVRLGLFIAAAIAIHNIPEGIVVSVPIFYATGNRNKAFFYSFLSGLFEPAAAIIGYFVLMPFLTPTVIAFLLALIAGIMVYISLDELLPAAHHYGQSHLVIVGIILGMLIMAISLLMI